MRKNISENKNKNKSTHSTIHGSLFYKRKRIPGQIDRNAMQVGIIEKNVI